MAYPDTSVSLWMFKGGLKNTASATQPMARKKVSCWIREERNAGFDVQPRIVEECPDQSTATVREAHYIELLRAKGHKLTNSTQGNGQGSRAAWLTKVLLTQREQMRCDREWFLEDILGKESSIIHL